MTNPPIVLTAECTEKNEEKRKKWHQFGLLASGHDTNSHHITAIANDGQQPQIPTKNRIKIIKFPLRKLICRCAKVLHSRMYSDSRGKKFSVNLFS